MGASLRDVAMQRSTFDQADFTNADLSDAITGGSSFDGAIFDNTICPDGENSDDLGGSCAL